VNNLVQLAFTPSAGTLTLTPSGSVTNAQVENLSFATSCIVTTSTTVTRAADALSTTHIPWFNANAGTIEQEFIPLNIPSFNSLSEFSDGTQLNTPNRVALSISNGEARPYVCSGGTCSVNQLLSAASLVSGTINKMGFAYANQTPVGLLGLNGVTVAGNGLAGTGVFVAPAGVTTLYIGNRAQPAPFSG
jgi:hypothetical protein